MTTKGNCKQKQMNNNNTCSSNKRIKKICMEWDYGDS